MFPLKDKHTLALNAHCKEFMQLQSMEEVVKLTPLSEHVLILGGGSNIGFIDDFEGQIVSFVGQRINIIEKDRYWLVEAEAGVEWHHLVEYLVGKGIAGLENLALIPGNCGAAPVQNIGAYGVEFSQYCHQVHSIDLRSRKHHVFSVNDCGFGYRTSVFKDLKNKELLITKIILKLPKLWKAALGYKGLDTLSANVTPAIVMNKVIEIRQSKLPDPGVLANAGSFFKNPVVDGDKARQLRQEYADIPCFALQDNKVKLSAGWLIEKAGFKGKQTGNIGIYGKHALVLVNHGNGGGSELLKFARSVRDEVKSMFGVKLENEVLLMGKTGLVTL